MPPFLALALWVVFVLGLLRFDPARQSIRSWALWVPVCEFFIQGSRLPSQWLGGYGGILAAQSLEGGNALDRIIRTALILLAIGILASRSFKWGSFFVRNIPLAALLLFCLVSVAWSDFPYVAIKRWTRDLEGYLVALVVLSDDRPLDAFRTVLRRVLFLLIPLSILLIKYFPAIGRAYDQWTGLSTYVGAATSKNMLGALCLLSGLFFLWDILTRWSQRHDGPTRQIVFLNVVFIAMTLWLLKLADSATSGACLALGCLVLVLAHTMTAKRYPTLIRGIVPVALCIVGAVALVFGSEVADQVARTLGRDPTLTDRTIIWNVLLSMDTNPLIGTGYESFWLGSRLRWVWEVGYGHINEAHNGYLQVYLNLGLIGLFLVVSFVVAAYIAICKRLVPPSPFGSLGLALWTVLVVYNVTEAAFLAGVLWIALLPLGVSWGDRGETISASTPDTMTRAVRRRRSFAQPVNGRARGTASMVGGTGA
jgi:exopolysaccharide production protein ExoQ